MSGARLHWVHLLPLLPPVEVPRWPPGDSTLKPRYRTDTTTRERFPATPGAPTATPAPTPERILEASSRVRAITDSCWTWSPLWPRNEPRCWWLGATAARSTAGAHYITPRRFSPSNARGAPLRPARRRFRPTSPRNNTPTPETTNERGRPDPRTRSCPSNSRSHEIG